MKSNRPPVRIWDLPVRLLHWALAGCVLAAWLTRHQTGDAHLVAGYAAAAVVLLRVLWSFAGNRYARFAQFVRPRPHTLAYVRQLRGGDAPRYLGHNPLGGWMVVGLLGMVSLLAATGWALDTDLLWGYAWPVRIHEAIAWIFIGMIGLHVAGVLLSSWLHRENLVGAMVTGKKDAPQPGDID